MAFRGATFDAIDAPNLLHDGVGLLGSLAQRYTLPETNSSHRVSFREGSGKTTNTMVAPVDFQSWLVDLAG